MRNHTNYSSQLLVSSETIVTGCATSKWLCATREATVHQATEHPETMLAQRLLVLPEEHLRHVPLRSSLRSQRHHRRRPRKLQKRCHLLLHRRCYRRRYRGPASL